VSTSIDRFEIGIIVDAGPGLGYGHAVRCIRLARALEAENQVVFYPLSPACREFVEAAGFSALPERIEDSRVFPRVVITDLREPRGITATIRRHRARHISIHDLGLGQCHSDVAVDGSITRLFPFSSHAGRTLFLGPQYMITRAPVRRGPLTSQVLVTLGGGATATQAQMICDEIAGMGLDPVATRGFSGGAVNGRAYREIRTDQEIADAMSGCRFAVSGSGVTLYELLASGIPAIAVAFDPIQLRTAEAFHELGAVVSAGLRDRLSAASFRRCCRQMLENRRFVQRMTEAGRTLVDGKGLSRVVDIVRRQLWLTSQVKTFTVC
jgi:spore coat polysaccharide biosynthesis predicted glycosyltransferase SpsG